LIRRAFSSIFRSPDMPVPRPVLNDRLESNIQGLYVVGDLAGAPVIKLAMAQGYRVAVEIASKAPAASAEWDAIVVGAGAAGLNAALAMQARGLRVLVLEKGCIGATVDQLPAGKWIYAEPTDEAPVGPLVLEEQTKEQLVELWRDQVRRAALAVREHEPLTRLSRDGSKFDVETAQGVYSAPYVVLAIGKYGTPRKLGVSGEDLPHVHTRLTDPARFARQRVIVVGGGNSAAEAAVALAGHAASVLLSYRGDTLTRVSKTNRAKLDEAIAGGRLELRYHSSVREFRPGVCVFETGAEPCDAAFVLIGSKPPRAFLNSVGLRLENEWTGQPRFAAALAGVVLVSLSIFGGTAAQWPALAGALLCAAYLLWRGAARHDRYALLAFTGLLAYTVYGAKQAPGHELWPFRGWGFEALSFFGRPWSFWYTVLYTAAMTVFGIQAMKRWGWDRKDRFQIWRYVSLLGFQWVFFFLIPEFLFHWAVQYQWVGQELASDSNFAGNAWRSYGLVYAWPLFFYTFFGSPHQIWILWGVVLSFVIIPALALVHGKRYCSWICGCGGLAETVGDRWRHLAPKGAASIRWERMNIVVLVAAVAITLGIVLRDAIAAVGAPADAALVWYRLVADLWLVGILPVALYPFLGGKIWCRYWCPLAKMMEWFSAAFTRLKVSRFAIHANEKCIACEECTRNCQVGIDVMRFALRQETITTVNSSCIGCGICVTVCPMKVLSFAPPEESDRKPQLVQIKSAA
jgi:thioredoxin reductase/ferredoxin